MKCVVEGCDATVMEDDETYATVLIGDEQVKVHLCEAHIEWLRRGQLDSLSVQR